MMRKMRISTQNAYFFINFLEIFIFFVNYNVFLHIIIVEKCFKEGFFV